MRLLKIAEGDELSLTSRFIEDPPPYAALSHRWGDDEDEVDFKDFNNGTWKAKPGRHKILFCRERAKKDNLQHFWIDTCCIDKSDLSELTESINSMYHWYKRATKCYALLPDVSTSKHDNKGSQTAWQSAFRTSAWFARGWTLQELIAPRVVEFFSTEGDWLGNKSNLERLIHEITMIPIDVLRGISPSRYTPEARFQWAKHRKTKRKEDGAYCLFGIFEVCMPLLYGEGDRAFVRLKDEIAKVFRHQLDSRRHAEVETVSNTAVGHFNAALTVNEAVRIGGRDDQRLLLMKTLDFAQRESRPPSIKDAFSTTCQWLLLHKMYVNWNSGAEYDHHHGFLCIKGKPGAGKSTLMKFALAQAELSSNKGRNKRRRRNASGNSNTICLSFFFNARGGELEKSTIGMYRSVLYQLLQQAPELRDLLTTHHAILGYDDPSSGWTVDRLCGILTTATARLGQRQVRCFIDALDECNDNQVADMVMFFEELTHSARRAGNQLHICFASRHYPAISIEYGQEMILEAEAEHAQDVEAYVRKHLRVGRDRSPENIVSQILEKANGIFMWVVLVIPLLNEEYRHGRIFAVEQRLRELPEELGGVFAYILRRDQVHMLEFKLCLQWILFAERPLRPQELYFAVVSALAPSPRDLAAWDPEVVTLSSMQSFVISSSKGLAEITSARLPVVQFIHESVRDFLLKDKGLSDLWPELRSDLPHCLSHDALKHHCLNYLKVDISHVELTDKEKIAAFPDLARALGRRISSLYPFLTYAGRGVLYHANKAAGGVPQGDFLREFNLPVWTKITNLLEQFKNRHHEPNVGLSYVLAENGYAALLHLVPGRQRMKCCLGERYQYPVLAALANGHRDAIQVLLQQDANPELDALIAQFGHGESFPFRKNQTPLIWALDNGQKALADLLLSHTDTDFDARDGEGRTAVMLAAYAGYRDICLTLLDADINGLDIRDNGGGTPLFYAAAKGHNEVVLLLLNYGADPNVKDKSGNTALFWAIEDDRSTTVRLLAAKGVDLDIENNIGDTALKWAVRDMKTTVLRVLLDMDANVNVQDRSGDTPLMLACADLRRRKAATWLLEMGADVGLKNVRHETAFSITCDKWDEDISKTTMLRSLLQQGADVDGKDDCGRTALMMAARRNQLRLAQFLIISGADIDVKDNSGRTALMWASSHKSATAVMLLGRRTSNEHESYFAPPPADEDPDDQAAIIQLLLEKGANANLKDNFDETALTLAVKHARAVIGRMLSEARARDHQQAIIDGSDPV